jgi:hypothetical protein
VTTTGINNLKNTPQNVTYPPSHNNFEENILPSKMSPKENIIASSIGKANAMQSNTTIQSNTIHDKNM